MHTQLAQVYLTGISFTGESFLTEWGNERFFIAQFKNICALKKELEKTGKLHMAKKESEKQQECAQH